MATALPAASTKLNLDADTDDPKQARIELATLVDNVNQLRAYLLTLTGTDGLTATARAALGLAIGTNVLAPTGDGSGLTGIAMGATPAEKARAAHLDFRVTVVETAAAHAVVDGWTDVFTDQTGVDAVASLNETYDAVNDLYSTLSGYTADIIPVMTSNTTPSGTASASSEFSAALAAWHAFDNDLALDWETASTVTGTLSYDFGVTKTASSYSLSAGSSITVGRMPKSWTFEGSNTGAFAGEETVLDTQTNAPAWLANTTRTYAFTNTTAFRYYRWNITLNQGDATYLSLTGAEIFEFIPAPNMTLQSNAATALAQPSSVFAVLWHEFVDTVTLNTDLKVWVSRDGGVTWTQVTLTLGAILSGNQQILTGTADLSAQPVGTSLKWKIETLNAKAQYVRGVSEQWS